MIFCLQVFHIYTMHHVNQAMQYAHMADAMDGTVDGKIFGHSVPGLAPGTVSCNVGWLLRNLRGSFGRGVHWHREMHMLYRGVVCGSCARGQCWLPFKNVLHAWVSGCWFALCSGPIHRSIDHTFIQNLDHACTGEGHQHQGILLRHKHEHINVPPYVTFSMMTNKLMSRICPRVFTGEYQLVPTWRGPVLSCAWIP